jgi:hypothetical protein
MSDEDADADQKVLQLFRSAAGDHAEVLRGEFHNQNTLDVIATALVTRFGDKRAREIAFHLADWNSDAAFIVAMHLFPENFTAEEIIEGVEGFLIHAPNHVAAAAKLGGYPIEDIFKVGAIDGASKDADR